MEPEVKFHSIGIISSDFGEITNPFPINEDEGKKVLFNLQEGSEFRLKLTFSVLHNIVSGLAYTNTVWKKGLQVDQSRGMLGTFAPQREPYVHTLEEETTPSGVLARGVYTAKLKADMSTDTSAFPRVVQGACIASILRKGDAGDCIASIRLDVAGNCKWENLRKNGSLKKFFRMTQNIFSPPISAPFSSVNSDSATPTTISLSD
ncbi:hypothetical protein BUALT_Bualt13G0023900 [Buddleja alternifolia]|uniref:Uncharacterized protein n=1 Tax=Buddleja alternifolia TaxID=168488 RepID=A0AAV6WQV8_9LAMI|nr:hypothetical protein BUALT_Bualt13G0023900 [Buddleja alternifolia]